LNISKVSSLLLVITLLSLKRQVNQTAFMDLKHIKELYPLNYQAD